MQINISFIEEWHLQLKSCLCTINFVKWEHLLYLFSDWLPVGVAEGHGTCIPTAEGHSDVCHGGHDSVHRVLWELSGGGGVWTHTPCPG